MLRGYLGKELLCGSKLHDPHTRQRQGYFQGTSHEGIVIYDEHRLRKLISVGAGGIAICSQHATRLNEVKAKINGLSRVFRLHPPLQEVAPRQSYLCRDTLRLSDHERTLHSTRPANNAVSEQ